MKLLIALISMILLPLASSILNAQEPEQKLYRIHVTDFNRIKTIEKDGITVYNQKAGAYIDVQASPEQINNLNIEGAIIEFLGNNLNELYKIQPGLKSIPPFHGYQNTIDELAAIALAHPLITKLDTIGHSVLGRAIVCIKISDNPAIDEDEAPLLFLGNHHGNEVHSVEATLYQINYLVNNYGTDPEVTNWVNSMEIWYVPMVNPDGREAMQRANNHGVDLNRNYSVGWTDQQGHGTSAFSEPETRAVRDLAAKFPPIMSISYHTSGQYVLYSWTHTDDAAPDSAAMVYIATLVSESITSPIGHYTIMQGGRWYFTAGEYCDYMYVNHNTIAFTVEMGVSQAPDYSVIPEMVESNLKGMKTMLRQTQKAGVSGLVTDVNSGKPIVASIDIPSIDKQGKVPVRMTDSLFGRYYRYLAPGNYTFEVSAVGYRTIVKELTISADSLVHWDIQMERAAFLEIGQVALTDTKSGKTSGNGDGKINVGELLGLSMTLLNQQPIPASRVYAQIGSDNPRVSFLNDALQFGNIPGNANRASADTVLFRIDPDTHDGEELDLTVSIGDSAGFGWLEHLHYEVYAPKPELSAVSIDDTDGNQNGAFDNGETVTIELQVTNMGRQGIHGLTTVLSTEDPYFHVVVNQDDWDELDIGESHVFQFQATLSPDAPVAYLADFKLKMESAEGTSTSFIFELNNILGFYDTFENGVNGWIHASYGTTNNNHDDWQLGTPAGKGGDPEHAFSGTNCWGTDMGWDSWENTSWDGLYQASVYNYLSSPVIDCSNLTDVGLKFNRWLTTRVSDFARVKVNNQLVWESPRNGLQDTEWTSQIIDISDIADHNPAVTITFELQSNSSAAMGGWNIDDVIVANGLATGLSTADLPVMPDQPVLYDARPNPFSTLTIFSYYLPNGGPVELAIYDQGGILVKQMVSGSKPAGMHEISWDGTNGNGNAVPPGIYVIRLKVGNTSHAKIIVRL